MAIPPEPLRELLPLATHIVEAEVSAVLSTGPQPPKVPARPGATSVPDKTPSQVVTLKVRRVLRGAPITEITVQKPEGDYVLSPGNHGPFLLKDAQPHPVIIGRYGPDTYRLATLEHALAEAR